MCNPIDLAGIGIGPFNLSLAAISEKNQNLKTHFFDQKPDFLWHSEISFKDSDMQTSFLKDLVTGIDPTSPYSFLNYLVKNGLFHSFMNTGRTVVTRKEFELYCQWVTRQMPQKLSFNSKIESLKYDGDLFTIETDKEKYKSKHICIGTGVSPRIPEFSRKYLSKNFFHAKSKEISSLNLEGKRLAIIGGGQTGVEIFRNALKGKWGKATNITLVSSRPNLEPLDESPFTNEYFTPNYVENFYDIKQEVKEKIVNYQRLSSDGNTPTYLQDLYNDLYFMQNIEKSEINFKILPYRRFKEVIDTNDYYTLQLMNSFDGNSELIKADIVILCTGFENKIPTLIEPIQELIDFDPYKRFKINKDFSIMWDGHDKNKIFAQNFSRYGHGISEPQTSLMAWRSAVITNSVSNEDIYELNNFVPNFLTYETQR
ncbi:SidA/IucD/PvdA family monooxygenase [Halobacteriovorax sp. GB3]|uniref:lysine N(6)-hydroxylase/L-ornithine N(5)-oxygenase family protein n=1 Tax=Halobacteriovorax sp. GB3 TaxID=2719615 RepID=UPI002362708B|nr:SidA/IucD/PvdA family monooxygenase [Halobacteriovorax sp. GB3]MDD0851760.1 SidA/IucD/PvdA family monooxygenase [Halobacteriovorax sp. GB3]